MNQTGTRLRAAVAGSIAAGGFGQLALIVSGILIARLLGVEQRGHFALFTLLPGLLCLAGGLGVPVALTYNIAREPERVRAFVRAGAKIAIALLPALMGAHALFLYLLVREDAPAVRLAAVLSLVSLPAVLATHYALSIIQGTRAYAAFNILRLAPVVSYTAAVVAVALTYGGSLIAMTAAWSLANIITAGVTVAAAVRNVRRADPTTESVPGRKLIRFGALATLGAHPPLEQYRLDQLAVGILLSPSALGLYAVGSAFMNLPRLVAECVGLVAYPAVAGTLTRRGSLAGKLVLFALLASLAAVLVVQATISTLLPFFFGSEFAAAIPTARILVVAGALLGARRVLIDVAQGHGRAGVGAVAEMAGLLAFGAALVALVPGGGAESAALALLAAALASLMVLVGILLFPRAVALRALAPGFAVAALAIAAGGALALVSNVAAFSTIALGTAFIACAGATFVLNQRLFGDAFSLLNVATVFFVLTFGVGGLYYALGTPPGRLSFFDKSHLDVAIAAGLLAFLLFVAGYMANPLRRFAAVIALAQRRAPASPLGVAAVLLAFGWLARLETLALGRYFHVSPTGEIISTGSSWIVTAAATLPTLAAAYVGARSYIDVRGRALRFIYYALLVIELAWAVPTGSRANVLTVLLVAAVVRYYGAGTRLAWRQLTVAALATVFLILPFGLAYRGDNRHFQQNPRASLERATNEVLSGSPRQMLDRGLESTAARFSGVTSIAAIFGQGRSLANTSSGESLRWAAETFLPRALFRSKNDPGHFGNEFGRTYGMVSPEDRFTAIAVTQPGELYLSFGALGVLFGMPLLGALHRLIDAGFRRRGSDPAVLAVYALVLWQFLNGHESIVAVGLLGVVKLAVFCSLALLAASLLVSAVVGSRRTNHPITQAA